MVLVFGFSDESSDEVWDCRGICEHGDTLLYTKGPSSRGRICDDYIALCVWPSSPPLFSWDSNSKGARVSV